ncbi:nucleotide-binding alpha-beta plait domain-containing protein [Tanacetum coccineum]|uniref:Nucleotide-binding alpha-beta plait domain-containing protein n=1 Tax=Tanacetum coccineum TaxID=301880 RepID=A0ABQ5E9T1_9ASTR
MGDEKTRASEAPSAIRLEDDGWTKVSYGKRSKGAGDNNIKAGEKRAQDGNRRVERKTTSLDKVMDATATTFFFSKFPDDWGTRALWKLFDKYGSLVDLYVASKRTKSGDRFGFARFKNVSDVMSFEQKLASIRIGYSKIIVNVARYAKGSSNVKDNNTLLKPTTCRIRNNNVRQNGRSYRDAATGMVYNKDGQAPNPVLKIDTSSDVDDWLSKWGG